MKKGCAKWLAIWIVLILAYSWLLGNPVFGMFASVFMLIALGLLSTPIRKGEELALVKHAGYSPFRADATIFRDGKRIAVFGYVYPQHAGAIKAPFSHRECVAYTYAVHSGAGEDRHKKYEGFRMCPFQIITRRGDVKLFSFPELQGFTQTAENEMNYQNALQYVRSTTFQSFNLSEIRKAYESVIEDLMDAGGSVKKDTKFTRVETEPKEEIVALQIATENVPEIDQEDTLEETCVHIQDEVCLIGTWSESKKGIVSDYTESGKRVTLIKGNEQQVLASIRKAMIVYPLIGLVIALAVNLIVWLVVKR
jgi:hypothetical protein